MPIIFVKGDNWSIALKRIRVELVTCQSVILDMEPGDMTKYVFVIAYYRHEMIIAKVNGGNKWIACIGEHPHPVDIPSENVVTRHLAAEIIHQIQYDEPFKYYDINNVVLLKNEKEVPIL